MVAPKCRYVGWQDNTNRSDDKSVLSEEPVATSSRPTVMTRSLCLTAAGLATVALLAGCGTATATATAGPGIARVAETATPVSHPIAIRPTQSGNCAGLTLDLAAGYKGYPTPAKAITAFLTSGTASFPLPKTGWTTHDHSIYTSGAAHLHLLHITDGGYAVNEANIC